MRDLSLSMGKIVFKGIKSLPLTWIFNSKYLHISDGLNLWCFKLRLYLTELIPSLKYLMSTTLGSIDIGIVNSELVAKTQFLYKGKGRKSTIFWNTTNLIYLKLRDWYVCNLQLNIKQL